jgi:hypothetical protein
MEIIVVDMLTEPLEPDSETLLETEGHRTGIVHTEVHVKGKSVTVQSTQIEQRIVVTTGKWLKVAEVRHEELVEGDTIADPDSFVSQLKKSGLGADFFTFAQRIPDIAPKYSYLTGWENVAAISITGFSHWWRECAAYSIRKAVNRAKKLGVVARVVEFDDKFVEATCPIYNEIPVRQGKAFWHYGKDFQSIKHALATYLERSVFIGAYYQDELIGFTKITWVGTTGTITQILSMKRHFDKRPNNALIAKAIEICEAEGKSHFIYGSFVYYDPDSSLTEFKRRNGFEAVQLPRYYVPLTLKGRAALKLGLHRGVARNTPKPILRLFLKVRRLLSERRLKGSERTL